MKFYRSGGILAIGLILALSCGTTNGWAQGRDNALESVRALTMQLIVKTESSDTSDARIWAGVQGLTDAIRRFVLSETEIRADEKVESPPLASLRPGEEEAPDRELPPGRDTALRDVPNAWFNARVTDAQAALSEVRDGLEGQVSRTELATRLRYVLDALQKIDRPPEQ